MAQLFYAGAGSALHAAEEVIPFLGKPTHWREGRSAYEAAHSWFAAQDLPPAVRALIDTDAVFAGASLKEAFFERQTILDALGRASQTDVLAFLKIVSGIAVLGVEAKVDESFGPLVSEWLDASSNKQKRLDGLVDRLMLAPASLPELRYQLLHRTVATLIEAEQVGAQDAAMIVQSFGAAEQKPGFGDFQSFASAIGIPVDRVGALSAAKSFRGVRLRLGWAQDRVRSHLA